MHKPDNVYKFIDAIKVSKRGSELRPHKYLLLLSICDLFEKNPFHENKFKFEELEPIFIENFNRFFKSVDSYRKKLELPFYYLQSDGFWNIGIRLGKEAIFEKFKETRPSKSKLLEVVNYAYLDKEIYNILMKPSECINLKNMIVKILKELSSENSISKISDSDKNAEKVVTSLFQHEKDAINEIKNNIEKSKLGKLISNTLIYESQTHSYYEIDILLATIFGIFIIELKHWTGNICIKPYNWIVNESEYRPDPHRVNNLKAKIAKGIYQERFVTYPNLWFESVVIMTNSNANINGASIPNIAAEQETKNPTFTSIGDFILYLKKRKSNTNNPIINIQQMEAIVEYFNTLNKPKNNIKYSIPGYETIEYISQKSNYVELISRPLNEYGRGLYRFRVFRPSQNIPKPDIERFKKKAYNTIRSVEQIGEHPNIHRVWIINNNEGDIIEGSEWSETGTLRDLIINNKNKIKTTDAINICQGILRALDVAHKAEVIHRAIKPENILILNGIPKLMNFDLAYQVEDNRITVIEDISKLKDDGYIAPEILLEQDIDESTDLFSFAVIAYELLAGERPFGSVREYLSKGGKLESKKIIKLNKSIANLSITNVIIDLLNTNREERLKNIQPAYEAFLIDIGKTNKIQDTTRLVNDELSAGQEYDVYKIDKLITKGKESQIYKATTLGSKLVALKLYNKEVPRERILREAEITSKIKSPYLIQCNNRIGYWNNDRYFIVLEYLQGKSLRELIKEGERPDLHYFKKIASRLTEAILAFHMFTDINGNKKPYIHSDIKPDNIIITDDNRPVLIDCGIAGEPRIDTFMGTIGYIPPDSLSGTDRSYSEDGDIFGLGVTLWEWLFGYRPYDIPDVNHNANIPDNEKNNVPEYIQALLLKSVATCKELRFQNIHEMSNALSPNNKQDKLNYNFSSLDTIKRDEEKIQSESKENENSKIYDIKNTNDDTSNSNPFVYYLNSISNASAGNENATAETQILNENFKNIEVENPITSFIYNKLINENNNIILTGNAGDGKTTIAIEIFTKLTNERRYINPVEVIKDKNICIIKDMSELSKTKRIKFLKEAKDSKSLKYLIISNTGTLLESFKNFSGNKYYSNEILSALESNSPTKICDSFLVVNIARMDSIRTACKVLKRILNPINWEICSKCKIRSECPIHINYKLLSEKIENNQGNDNLIERFELIYHRLHEYNMRLTMRQMTGHLAYSITGGYNCKNINNMSITARRHKLRSLLFFNRFFGDDGKDPIPEAMQLIPIQYIRKLGFGNIHDAYFERETWLKQNHIFSRLKTISANRQILEESFLDINDPYIRLQARRFIYFLGEFTTREDKHYLGVFLRSPMLIEYLTLLKNMIPTQDESHRKRILHVLQEYFIGIRLNENIGKNDQIFITLKQDNSRSGVQIVLADLCKSDFEISIKPIYTIDNVKKSVLCMTYKNRISSTEIILDLPLLDYVAHRHEGNLTEQLSQYYSDRIEKFKSNLLKTQNNNKNLRLLKIGNNRKFEIINIEVTKNGIGVL